MKRNLPENSVAISTLRRYPTEMLLTVAENLHQLQSLPLAQSHDQPR
jgi:hypothetical protein